MPFWNRPIYEAELALSIADAFAAASEFALGFPIRALDRESLQIVLDLTSLPSNLLFFTWVQAYVFRVFFRDEKLSCLRVYAKRAFSPHHLLRLPFFISHRIDPDEFRRHLEDHFGPYESRTSGQKRP